MLRFHACGFFSPFVTSTDVVDSWPMKDFFGSFFKVYQGKIALLWAPSSQLEIRPCSRVGVRVYDKKNGATNDPDD